MQINGGKYSLFNKWHFIKRNKNMCLQKACTEMFIAALFKIAGYLEWMNIP